VDLGPKNKMGVAIGPGPIAIRPSIWVFFLRNFKIAQWREFLAQYDSKGIPIPSFSWTDLSIDSYTTN